MTSEPGGESAPSPDEEEPGPARAGRRALTAVVAALFVGTAGTWLMALGSAVVAQPPVLVVGAPTATVAGATLPVRVVALDVRRTAIVEGRFRFGLPALGEPRARLANVPVPEAAGERSLVVEGPVSGPDVEASATVTLPVEVRAALAPRASFTFRPWTRTVLRGQGGPPLYPGFGDVPSTRESWAVVVKEDAEEQLRRVPIQANPAETRDPFGRVLRLDREDRLLTGPLEVRPGEGFAIEVEPDRPVEVDLLVDGWPRLVAAGAGRIPLVMPADARPGAPFVVHVSHRPYPRSEGVFYVGRVFGEGLEPLPAWAARLVQRSGGEGDPLAALLADEQARARLSPELLRSAVAALTRRLEPETLRAARRGPSSEEQKAAFVAQRAASIDEWRLPFRILGGLFALLAAAFTVVSLRDQARARAAARDDEGARVREPILPTALGLLALVVGLGVLWVLDWILGLSL